MTRLEDILTKVNESQDKGESLVLVTGVFDVLHQEHVAFLNKAKKAGDRLVVGLESDVRVKHIKGQGRPIHSQEVRQNQIENLRIADWVFVLPEDFGKPEHHRKLIATLKPAVLGVSSHSPHLEAKQRILQEFGGRVEVVHEHNPEFSSTKIIEKNKLLPQ